MTGRWARMLLLAAVLLLVPAFLTGLPGVFLLGAVAAFAAVTLAAASAD